jgi:hypothetical protein
MSDDNQKRPTNVLPIAKVMTFEDFLEQVAVSDKTFEEKLSIYNKAGDVFIKNIFMMFFDLVSSFQTIDCALHMDSIMIVKNSKHSRVNILQPKTYEFEICPSPKTSLYRRNNKKNEYTKQIYKTWDYPYLKHIFSKFKALPYSFEMYLIKFIYLQLSKGIKKEKSETWLSYMASNEYIMEHMKEFNTMLYISFGRIMKEFESAQYNKKYRRFENKLIMLVKVFMKSENSFETIQGSKKLQKFLDALKLRSHLPNAYGMFIHRCMESLGMTMNEMKKYIIKPQNAPNKLKDMILYYWGQMLIPVSLS